MPLREAGTRVKLYFMLGLPTETVEDMEGIALLSEKIAEEYYEIPEGSEKRKGPGGGQHLLLCAEALYAFPVGQDVHQGASSWIRRGLVQARKIKRNAES